MNNLRAIILAGGRGSRLGVQTESIPKPLIKIGNISVIEHQILLLKKYNIKDIIITVSYLHQNIKDKLGLGKRYGVNISYYVEDQPMGTAGAIKHLFKSNRGSVFMILYGDVMVNMNLQMLINFYKYKQADVAIVTHPNDHPFDSDIIDVDQNDRVVNFYSKPHHIKYFKNLVNAGLYITNDRIADFIPDGNIIDFGKNVFPISIRKIKIFSYNTVEYLKDMGTPDRLRSVIEDFESNKIQKANLENKRRAIFIDRDGVVNENIGLLYKMEQFRLLPRVAEAIKMINKSDYIAILVTNQPVIARNLCTISRLNDIHKKMETLLSYDFAKLDYIYYCPHHPDSGYEGENKEYKIKCRCRKPNTLMIEMAKKRFNIDLSKSFVIGDSYRDILMGKRMQITTIAVKDYLDEGKNVKPDFFSLDLYDAVIKIINK